MATKGAYKRLNKEYLMLQKNPPPFITAKPSEGNILEWHYVITGPPDSPYAGGEYWGKLLFPSDYPYKPPGIKILTPNGRFKTDFRLCLSMSDYHPNTWNPAWSVATILTGLLSFMLEDTPTTGSIDTRTQDKRLYAQKSHAWNRTQKQFVDTFPDLAGKPPPSFSKPLGTRLRKHADSVPPILPNRNCGQLITVVLRYVFASFLVYVIVVKVLTRAFS